MPVIRGGQGKPAWVRWSNCGLASLHDAEGFDRHFHDADEYWLVIAGRARVFSEGEEYEIGRGDVLCTRMGDEHDILEILEAPFKAFWFEDELRGAKRPGHLHVGVDAPAQPSSRACEGSCAGSNQERNSRPTSP